MNTYQQVYSSSEFPGVIDITGLDFFNTQFFTGGVVLDTGTFNLSFSYTAKVPEGLDLTDPANNIATGSQLFFSGPLPSSKGGTLDIVGQQPFLYNPALGNLLLTVTAPGAVDTPPYVFFDFADDPTQTGRAAFSTGRFGNFGNDLGGLVTDFVTATPEPTPIVLFISGLVMMALGHRKLRRTN